MSKTIRWLFWKIYYGVRPWPKTLPEVLFMAARTRPPWRKFKPYIYRNEDGKFWEIGWKSERTYTAYRQLELEVHISLETGEVVGLDLPDYLLRPAAEEVVQ